MQERGVDDAREGTLFELPSGETYDTVILLMNGSMIAETLKSVCETGRAPFKIRMLYVLFALTAPFTPARCRSENWP